MRIMVILPFISGFRFFCQGLLLQLRRTGLISLATGVRAVSLFFYLAIGQFLGSERRPPGCFWPGQLHRYRNPGDQPPAVTYPAPLW